MHKFRLPPVLGIGILLMNLAIGFRLQAGGSGINTIVVLNQNGTNSIELANYFCERRQVPPENVLRISWTGGNISWTDLEFQSNLLDPLRAMWGARRLTNQIDYVVLSMDIPFQTMNGSFVNSTTAALFYGLQTRATASTYAGSETIFGQLKPISGAAVSFLTTMITSDSLDQAKRLIDQGVASDGAFPNNTVVLARTSDPLRNIRVRAFDNAIFNSRIRGSYSIQRTNAESPWGQTNLLGYQTGLAGFGVSPGTFVPGAIADSLTSYGGVIFGPNGQTSLLAFINAGASGSYGTVTEPYPDPNKFPDPQVYFYQARGFSVAECYYQSLVAPYEGLIVAEPLAAPFARPGTGQWLGISSNAVLSGTAPLSVKFSGADGDHPMDQVDLFVDGKFLRTLTNIPPSPGNLLTITLNGYPLNYTVPADASISSIASGLTALINAPANTNATGIAGAVHGDRIELRFLNSDRPQPPTNLRISLNSAPGSSPSPPPFTSGSAGTAGSQTTFLVPSRPSFLPSPTLGLKSYMVSGTIQSGAWLRLVVTKPTGARITLSVTNKTTGASPFNLAQLLTNAVQSAVALQDLDGITVDDFMAGMGGSALFNLRARGQGYKSNLKVNLSGWAGLVVNPTGELTLNDNLSDLQPRNHVYLAAGTTNLVVPFALNTATLPDGYHELTAVAYEGSHVRTQTRTTVPVRFQNSSLSATLDLLDLPDTAPVQGTYHLQVTANTASVSAITLFSTGGALGTASNQSTAAFTINGPDLGAGLHPFNAVVETSGGAFRTQTRWVRLTR